MMTQKDSGGKETHRACLGKVDDSVLNRKEGEVYDALVSNSHDPDEIIRFIRNDIREAWERIVNEAGTSWS